jgi:hypothetical protein
MWRFLLLGSLVSWYLASCGSKLEESSSKEMASARSEIVQLDQTASAWDDGCTDSSGLFNTRLDHIPIAVDDLGRATSYFRDSLGFSIKPGRLHTNSLLNNHIKFRNGTALELITATEKIDALAAWYLDSIRRGPGGTFLALHTDSIDGIRGNLTGRYSDHDYLAGTVLSSISFKNDVSYQPVFVIQYHRTPDDPAELQTHANTAVGLHAVWIKEDQDGWAGSLLRQLVIEPCGNRMIPELDKTALVFQTHLGRMYLISDLSDAEYPHPIVGITVLVQDIKKVMPYIDTAQKSGRRSSADRRMVPPSSGFGLWIEFRAVEE